jgi:hypothetical protein
MELLPEEPSGLLDKRHEQKAARGNQADAHFNTYRGCSGQTHDGSGKAVLPRERVAGIKARLSAKNNGTRHGGLAAARDHMMMPSAAERAASQSDGCPPVPRSGTCGRRHRQGFVRGQPTKLVDPLRGQARKRRHTLRPPLRVCKSPCLRVCVGAGYHGRYRG